MDTLAKLRCEYEEMGKRIEELEKEQENSVVRITAEILCDGGWEDDGSSKDIYINNKRAFSMFKSTNRYHNIDQKNAMLFLNKGPGVWKDTNGNEISGYLSYFPMATRRNK